MAAATIRCLRAVQGEYNIVYTSSDECIQGVVYDKYFPDLDVRMICRGIGFIRRSTRIAAAGAQTRSRETIAEATRKTCYDHYIDVTLIKYYDCAPIDIPLDDPLVHLTAYAHSDTLKKYLVMIK